MAYRDGILATRAARLVALLTLLATSLVSATINPAWQHSPTGRTSFDAVAFLPAATVRTIGDGRSFTGEADRDGGPDEGPLDLPPGMAPSLSGPALSLLGSSHAEPQAQLHGDVSAGHDFSSRAPPHA